MDNESLNNLLDELKQEYNIKNIAIFNEYGTILASLLKDGIDEETFGITMATTFSAAETSMEETNDTIKKVVVDTGESQWIICKANSNILCIVVKPDSGLFVDIEKIIKRVETLSS